MDSARGESKRESQGHLGRRSDSSGLTRRRLLSAGPAGMMGAALGAAGFDRTFQDAAEAAAEPPVGGKASVGLIGTWGHLDPHRYGGPAFLLAQFMMAHIYDPLLVRDPANGTLRPGLADSYEVSADGKTLTFRIKSGVKFHDGTVCDAEAVKTSFDRILTDSKVVFVRSLLGPVDRVETAGAAVVRIRMRQPFAPILDALSLSLTAPVSPAAVKKYGDDFGQHPVGSGPFAFKEVVSGDHVTLARNSEYRWGPTVFANRGPAYLEEITYRVVTEDLTRMGLFERNELTMIMYPVAREIPRLRANTKYRVVEVLRPGVPRIVTLNVTRPPLDDIRVRTAIAHAINRQGIVKNVFENVGSPAYSMLTPVTFGYASSVDKLMPPYDLVRARALLAEAGWRPGPDGIVQKDGKKLHLQIVHLVGGVFATLHQLVQAYLRSVGIDSEVRGLEIAASSAALKGGQFDLSANQTNVGTDPDVLYQVADSASIDTSANWARYKSTAVDRLLEEARLTLDATKRKNLYAQAQTVLAKDLPYVPYYAQSDAWAVQAGISGLVFDVKSFPLFHSAFVKS